MWFYLNECEYIYLKNYAALVITIYMSRNVHLLGNWMLIAIVSHRDISARDVIDIVYIYAQSFEIHRFLKLIFLSTFRDLLLSSTALWSLL